jgi:hypothetical protein
MAAGRPDVAVVISDLAGIAEDEPKALKAIARLRRAAGSVVALVPAPEAFLPPATSVHGRRMRELLVRDARALTDPGRRMFIRHGITVVEAMPGDSLDRLIGRARGTVRRPLAV